MNRSPLFLLLCLVPLLFAGDADAPAPPVKVREECGIVPGERYWITTRGLVFPDGTLREDWKNCQLMEGITFSIRWDESDAEPALAPVPEPVRRYRVEAHSDCTGTPEEQATRSLRLGERIREQLVAQQKLLLTQIEVVPLGCTRPLVSPEVTDQDRAKNRRVEVILVGS